MNKLLKKCSLTFLFLFLFFLSPAYSQTGIEFQSNVIYDDNLLKNATSTSDIISEVYLSFYHNWGNHNESLYQSLYISNLNLLKDYNELFNHNHLLSLQYQKKFSDIKENYFYCGGQFSIKKYIKDYIYYDYTDALAYIKLKYLPINSGLLRSEYNLYYRRYSNLSNYDYIENKGELQYNQFLKTRTTLRIGVNFGNKYYNSITTNDSISVISTNQLTGTFLIAQSITKKTGIHFQYNHIYNITQSENYIDDSYYDDKYNYSGFEYIGGLTQIFPYNISVILKGGYNYHNYQERPILDSNGIPLPNSQNRIDKIGYGNLRIEKEFSDYFYFFIDYSYKKNTSNDDFYNYTNSIYSTGLNVSL